MNAQHVTLSYSAISLAEKFAADDDSRPILAGLHLDAHRELAEAADGYKYGRLPFLDDDQVPILDASVIVPRDTLLDIKKLIKKGTEITIAYVPEYETWRVIGTGKKGSVFLDFTPISGDFADVSTLIPDTEGSPSAVHLNPHYLKALCETAIVSGSNHVTMHMHPKGELHPVRFDISGSAKILGVIASMGYSNEESK